MKWSGVPLVVTIVVSCILCVGLIASFDNKAKFIALAAMLIAVRVCSAVAVRVTDSELT